MSEQTAEQIETVIFHKNDNPQLGEVIYMPAANGTGIKGIATQEKADVIYDLQGRKINSQFSLRECGVASSIFNSQLKKGLYIVNGKKVVR